MMMISKRKKKEKKRKKRKRIIVQYTFLMFLFTKRRIEAGGILQNSYWPNDIEVS